jgi:type I restriction enzyme, S subunit
MKYAAYPEYAATPRSRAQAIPTSWQWIRLKRVTSLAYGDSLADADRLPGPFEVFGSNGVVGQHDRANTLGPCIIVGRKGSFGKVVYSEAPSFAIDTTFYADAAESKHNLRWLYYVLLWLRLDALGKDSAVPGLAREDAYDRELPLCSPPEQQAIAAFLDRETGRIDEMIAAKQRLIGLLEEKRAALISHAVTRGLNPNARLKDTGIEWLGQIPEHWTNTSFRRICRLQQGLQIVQSQRHAEPGPGRVPYITVQAVHAGESDTCPEFIAHPPASVTCQPDDILMARTGATGEVITDRTGAFHNNFFRVDYNRSLVLRDYLVYYLSHPSVRAHLQLVAGTTTIPDLNHGAFLDTPFVRPPIAEQQDIVLALDRSHAKLDALLAKVREGIALLQEFRTALISAAVTGKIDVRGDLDE